MYDFQETVDEVIDLPYHEMIHCLQEKIRFAEQNAYSGKNGCVTHRQMGATEYAERLKALVFFISNNAIPGSASDQDIIVYKIVTNRMIKNGVLKPEAIEVLRNV